jgi:hypothetical protein
MSSPQIEKSNATAKLAAAKREETEFLRADAHSVKSPVSKAHAIHVESGNRAETRLFFRQSAPVMPLACAQRRH